MRRTPIGTMLCCCGGLMLAPSLKAQCSNPTQVPNNGYSSGFYSFYDPNALAAAGVVVNASASVVFQAGNCIDLQPGFRATAGTASTTFHAWANTAPGGLTVSPASGTGTTQQFTWTASSPSGYTYLTEVDALFSPSGSTGNACYIRYNASSNLLYLADNSGANWLGGFVPGSSGSAANSQCAISGSGSSASGSGIQLSLTVSVAFQSSFAGNQGDYLIAYDAAGLNSELQQVGVWTVGSGGGGGTPAQMISPTPGTTLPSNSVQFTWNAVSGASEYALWIGTSVGMNNIFANSAGTATSIQTFNLPTDSSTVYVRLLTSFSGTWLYNDYTYTADPVYRTGTKEYIRLGNRVIAIEVTVNH